MKKMLSLLMVTVFSLSITAFAFAEGKPASDATSTKVEDQKTQPAAEKKTTAKKHTRKKKKSTKKKSAAKAEKTGTTEMAPEQPATKK